MHKYLAFYGIIIFIYAATGGSLVTQAQNLDTTDQTTDRSPVITLTQIDRSYDRARSLYVTSQPLIYVIETGLHRFLVLEENGARIDSVGNQGFGNYQFDRPVDIDATNGLKIYISDYHNGRIQVFDRRLQYLSSITPPRKSDQFYSYQPTVLTVSDNRELFFYETDSGRLVQYDENGELLSTIRVRTDRRLHPPADIASFNGQLLLADSVRDVIHILKPEGQYVRFIGGFEEILSLNTWSNSIWALSNSSILQFDANGRLVEEYKWDVDISPVDIGVYKRQVYVLTKNDLWKGKIPVD